MTCTHKHYYAALLPMRGPHYASHSVCPSVCLFVRLSVRPVIVATGPAVVAKQQRLYRPQRGTEGRISYGHLGRTDSCLEMIGSRRFCVCYWVYNYGLQSNGSKVVYVCVSVNLLSSMRLVILCSPAMFTSII